MLVESQVDRSAESLIVGLIGNLADNPADDPVVGLVVDLTKSSVTDSFVSD